MKDFEKIKRSFVRLLQQNPDALDWFIDACNQAKNQIEKDAFHELTNDEPAAIIQMPLLTDPQTQIIKN